MTLGCILGCHAKTKWNASCLEKNFISVKILWATWWENLFLSYANSKDTDQPAHPRSLISVFVIRCLDSIIPLVSISKISSLFLASLAAQTRSSLTWSEAPKTGFLMTWLLCFGTDLQEQTVQTQIRLLLNTAYHSIWASSWENVSSGCCDQIRLKPACSPTETSLSLWHFGFSKYMYYTI